MKIKRVEPYILEFPDGTEDENPSANAGNTGLIPSLGRSHRPRGNCAHAPQLLKPVYPKVHMPQLLSPRAATAEARVPRACAQQTREATTRGLSTAGKSSPSLTPTRESPGAAMKTKRSQKQTKKILTFYCLAKFKMSQSNLEKGPPRACS